AADTSPAPFVRSRDGRAMGPRAWRHIAGAGEPGHATGERGAATDGRRALVRRRVRAGLAHARDRRFHRCRALPGRYARRPAGRILRATRLRAARRHTGAHDGVARRTGVGSGRGRNRAALGTGGDDTVVWRRTTAPTRRASNALHPRGTEVTSLSQGALVCAPPSCTTSVWCSWRRPSRPVTMSHRVLAGR